MDPFTFLIFALLAVAVALVVTAMMKRPRTRRKATIVPPRPVPAQPDLWPEFSKEQEQIRDALMARRSSATRITQPLFNEAHYHPLAAQAINTRGISAQRPSMYMDQTTAGNIPMPTMDSSEWIPIMLPDPAPSYSAPDPEPTPTFGGGDSGGAGATDSWSSSSCDTSSSYDSSSSSCDSSPSGGSDY